MADLTEKYLHDLEKSTLTTVDSASSYIYPPVLGVNRKLVLSLLVETVVSLAIYYNYDQIGKFQPFLAPALLGASTGALAQSINQYSKKKFSLNRICKFIVWGSINGLFTVLWIDMLISRFDNLFYRIIVDQMVGAPSFQLVFNILNSLWDHGEVSNSTRLAYFKSLKYSYFFWPFFSIASFIFIPKALMFPSNCLANLIWGIILSKMT